MNEIAKLEARIAELPRGSITKKVIQGKDRYYLQWREADKVKSRYVNLTELPQLSSQIELRRQLQQRVVELQVASIQNAVSGGSFRMVAETAAHYRSDRINGESGSNCYGSSSVNSAGNVGSNFFKNSRDVLLVNFFLNLERGYCLESSRKTVSAGDCVYVADAVFYNRLLRCHVIVSAIDHEISKTDVERLESCVSYFRNHVMQPVENMPVGILLCRHRGGKMVEFVKAGIGRDVFTAVYKPKMPTKKELDTFLNGGEG